MDATANIAVELTPASSPPSSAEVGPRLDAVPVANGSDPNAVIGSKAREAVIAVINAPPLEAVQPPSPRTVEPAPPPPPQPQVLAPSSSSASAQPEPPAATGGHGSSHHSRGRSAGGSSAAPAPTTASAAPAGGSAAEASGSSAAPASRRLHIEEIRDGEWLEWSPDDVGDWVDALLGESCGAPFRVHRVDGPTLLELSDEDLQSPLGVTSSLHRKKLLGHIRVFRLKRARMAQVSGRQRWGASTSPGRGPAESELHHNEVFGLAASPSMPGFYGGYPAAPDNGGMPPYMQAGSRRPHVKRSASYPERRRQYGGAFLSGRTPAEVSSASGDSSHREDEQGRLPLSGRFSRYMNPSKPSTVGLTSSFGLDSPSYSLRGSWATAPSRPRDENGVPGPCAYHVENLHGYKSAAPRATIGSSPRDTSEYLVNGSSSSLNAGKQLERADRRVKGGVIGRSSRWGSNSGRNTPGPCSYCPRLAFLSTFK